MFDYAPEQTLKSSQRKAIKSSPESTLEDKEKKLVTNDERKKK